MLMNNTFEINVIDSNQFQSKEFASCEIPFEDSLVKPDKCLPGLYMVSEQKKDACSQTETCFYENVDDAMSVNEIRTLDTYDKVSPELSNKQTKKKKKKKRN